MEAWDEKQWMRYEFCIGSQIIVTTRQSSVIDHLSFLDNYKCWDLFCQKNQDIVVLTELERKWGRGWLGKGK